jgi:hypothetical protein
MGRDELWAALPASPRLMQDLLMYKRTEKYVRQNVGATQEATVNRILTDRQLQNNERMIALRALVADLVLQATLTTKRLRTSTRRRPTCPIRRWRRGDQAARHTEALEKLDEWSAACRRRAAAPQPIQTPATQPSRGPITYEVEPQPDPEQVVELTAQYVPHSTLQSKVQAAFTRPWLADERDIETYLEVLRTALLDVIKSGKRVRI